MKHYIVGQLKGVVVFVHDYETKAKRDKAYDGFTKLLQNPAHLMWMNWYGCYVDDVQKSDCI